MKNAYLNNVFIFRLYQRTIQKKKNKNILLIKQRKRKNIENHDVN